MKPLTVLTFSLLLTFPLTTDAQEGASNPTDLHGKWQADCNAWGTPARCVIKWKEGLNPGLLAIRYAIIAAEGEKDIFRGQGVYRLDSLKGYWSDSQAVIHPLTGAWENGVLMTHWGSPPGRAGKTRYALGEDGSMTVTDWSLTEAGWQQFMEVTYQRVERKD